MHWRLIRLTRPFICFSLSLTFGLEALQTLVVRYGRFLALMLFDCSSHSLCSLQLCAEVCGSVDGNIVVVDVLRVTSLSSGDYSVTACMWDFRFLTICTSIWENILGLSSARSCRKREGFGYPGSWLLGCFSVAVRLQSLLVSFSSAPINLFLKKIQNTHTNARVLTLNCSFNGRFDLLDANGSPNASATSCTGKPGLNHGIPPCWLWWMGAIQWLLWFQATYLAVGY